jgi:hypothetical protein
MRYHAFDGWGMASVPANADAVFQVRSFSVVDAVKAYQRLNQ